MKIVWLPLEKLEMRYTKDWSIWWPREFEKLGIDYIAVEGTELTSNIELGSVLDAYGTVYFKATQLANLIELMHSGKVTSDDILLFADLWSPGIEALQYIANLGGARPKITGVLHAGTWDENDFLVRSNLRPFFHEIESSWFKMFDLIFLGSEYHKELILNSHSVNPDKLVVTGLPFYPDEFTLTRANIKKDNHMMVFPHRLDKEKHPEEFDSLMSRHPEWRGYKTASYFTTKDCYYDELARASVAVSLATQETFGYAMLEATALGCIPLVPDRLSYQELFPEEFRYQELYELEDKLTDVMKNSPTFRRKLPNMRRTQRETGMTAIGKMCQAISDKF